jgi:two-component system, NarL family, nitrate/nitrite response regulator NarL
MRRALLVTPSRVYCESLRQALEATGEAAVVGVATSADEAIAEARRLRPDALVVDLPLADARRVSTTLRHGASPPRIVAFDVPDDEQQILAWARLGALGCITRDAPLAELVAAVVGVGDGEGWCSARAASALLRYARNSREATPSAVETTLTRRESEILRLVGEGLTNKDIAHVLSLSVSTVKNHIHHIFQKLRIRRRRDAASWIGLADASLGDDGRPGSASPET